MPQLIEVGFKGNRKEFFLWEADEAPPLRAPIIVDADRGEDLGLVHSTGELAEQRSARSPMAYTTPRSSPRSASTITGAWSGGASSASQRKNS